MVRQKPCGDVVVAEPLTDEAAHVALGRGERCLAAGWPFAFAMPALGVGDGFLSGQGGAFGPGGSKIRLAQGISKHRHRGLVAGVIDLEPHHAHALPTAVCRTEQPRRFAVSAGLAGQIGEDLEDVGNTDVRLDFSGTR